MYVSHVKTKPEPWTAISIGLTSVLTLQKHETVPAHVCTFLLHVQINELHVPESSTPYLTQAQPAVPIPGHLTLRLTDVSHYAVKQHPTGIPG